MAERDFILANLTGGMNNSDSPTDLEQDQCVLAQNAEWRGSRVGERRRGAEAIDITGSDLVGHDMVTFLGVHTPGDDLFDAELWALAVTNTGPTFDLCRKDTSWHTLAFTDNPDVTEPYRYQMSSQSHREKFFLAYKSAQDRLHVCDDGITVRRVGLATPDAPVVADTAVGGSYSGTRFVRVRYIRVLASGETIRSEPSESTEFEPDGSFNGIVVTKPASIGESETHWEVEFSLDDTNFYRLTTLVVATTTYTDQTDFDSGYANAPDSELSEEIGLYTPIWSARFLLVDQDRLIPVGGFTDATSCRFGWTPVYADVGDGNNERLPATTDNYKDLDKGEGGRITGVSRVADGYFYIFKRHAVYKVLRTGRRENAYDVFRISDTFGAIEGSIFNGVDQVGAPTVFFFDPEMGPCLIGSRGVEVCGWDLRKYWTDKDAMIFNADASKVPARGCFYHGARQAHWWIPTEGSDVPNFHVVLNVQHMRNAEDGRRKGWSIWPGDSEDVLAVCEFAENIDDNDNRSAVTVPFLGRTGGGLIWRTDTGDEDNGEAYEAILRSRPFLHGNLLHEFEAKEGVVMAKAATGVTVDIAAVANLGVDSTHRKDITDISLTPVASEEFVIKYRDDLGISGMRTIQLEVKDSDPPTGRWEVGFVAVRETTGQKATGR